MKNKWMVAAYSLIVLYTATIAESCRPNVPAQTKKGATRIDTNKKIKLITSTYESHIHSHSTTTITIDTFDTRGCLLVSRSYDHPGHIIGREEYEYDSVGNRIKGTQFFLYDDGTILASPTWYSYNKQRQLISSVNYLAQRLHKNWDTAMNIRYYYRYDSAGRVTEEIQHQSGPKITRYAYPDKYTIITETTYSTNPEKTTNIARRNDQGDLLWAKTVRNGDTLPMQITHDSTRYGATDEAGNWLEQTNYREMLGSAVTRRVIVYY